MFRFRLRTLLILMAILPPLLWLGWTKYSAWRAEQQRRAELGQVSVLNGGWVVDIREWITLVDGQAITADEPSP